MGYNGGENGEIVKKPPTVAQAFSLRGPIKRCPAMQSEADHSYRFYIGDFPIPMFYIPLRATPIMPDNRGGPHPSTGCVI